MKHHQYFVYFMANPWNTTLYIGVSNNLEIRALQHKKKENKGFTAKYNVTKLVYFETFNSIEEAISREKQLKNWKRSWKNALIEKENPTWKDLSDGWYVEADFD